MMNNIFNRSYDDLTFLSMQMINNENLDKYIFVFDFDLTMTTMSTNNIDIDNFSTNNIKYYTLFDSKEKINKLTLLLSKINNNNCPIYINTRALINHVNFILNKINFDLSLIKDIKGSYHDDMINNPLTINEIEQYNLTSTLQSNVSWALKKVIYLNEIKISENVSYDKILFFDDSKININTAKINGYMNSFLIGSNDCGLVGLDYLLIKLEQIINILF
jgi:hypothetical protein